MTLDFAGFDPSRILTYVLHYYKMYIYIYIYIYTHSNMIIIHVIIIIIIIIIKFKGWNSHVHMEFPGNLESTNLSRDNLSREKA